MTLALPKPLASVLLSMIVIGDAPTSKTVYGGMTWPVTGSLPLMLNTIGVAVDVLKALPTGIPAGVPV